MLRLNQQDTTRLAEAWATAMNVANKVNSKGDALNALAKNGAEGHFPAGSMGPKIKAAVDFIRNGGSEVVITSPEYLNAALTKGAGTHITKE